LFTEVPQTVNSEYYGKVKAIKHYSTNTQTNVTNK